MAPTHVHFNGSINLADTSTVFSAVTSRVPHGLRRIPDGETGERSNWINFQILKLIESPQFVPDTDGQDVEDYEERPRFRLAPGVSAGDVEWPDLGYATAYTASYQEFIAQREAGAIPEGVRFQVEYPTPLATVAAWIVPDEHLAIEESYGRALAADLERLLSTVPAEDIAVQWDVAVEFGILAGSFESDASLDLPVLAAKVARAVDSVPAEIPTGVHLCYGDLGHQHFAIPDSIEEQVQFVNTVMANATRPLDFAAFTVPQDRDDAAYFAAVSGLDQAANDDTALELSFGIVPYHPDEQVAGVTDRQIAAIDAALPAGREWAISTECGMGRMTEEEVLRTLDLHHSILGSV